MPRPARDALPPPREPAGPVPTDRLLGLVERERDRRDAAGALIPRPAADVAYRLNAWYRIRITMAEVAELLQPDGR